MAGEGSLPVRDHVRGPGGPLVLRLLPGGPAHQPGGARPAGPFLRQPEQRDRVAGPRHSQTSAAGTEHQSQVGSADRAQTGAGFALTANIQCRLAKIKIYSFFLFLHSFKDCVYKIDERFSQKKLL